MDADANMEEARIIGVRVLADFFVAMAAMKAHWYNLMVPSIFFGSMSRNQCCFPPVFFVTEFRY